MGNREEQLVRRFADANLRAVVAERALRSQGGFNSAEIFQMAIRGVPKKNRHFNIIPGAPENRVEVQGIDKDLHQLVMMVHEPARTFTQEIKKTRHGRVDRTQKIIFENDRKVIIERETGEAKRHFLMGTDERDYFVAQLPQPVSTVRKAHEVLRPPVARQDGVVRQGEWFFLEPSKAEREQLEALTESGKLVTWKKMPIGPAYLGRPDPRQRAGNPHTADELTLLRGLNSSTLFIRGKVRHVDHETKEFYSWVKVALNTEARTEGIARMGGVAWID